MQWVNFLLFFRFVASIIAQTPQPSISTPTPTPTSSPNTELLIQQLKFFQDASNQLAQSFNGFVSALNLSFVVIAIVLGTLGLFGAFFYGKTLDEVKQRVGSIAREEVERIVSVTIKDRVDYLQRVLEREEVIGWIGVDYLLPTNQGTLPPTEYQLLKARGFQDVNFSFKAYTGNHRNRLLVLDLVNHSFSEEEVAKIIQQILDNTSSKAVIVIYIDHRSSAVDELLKDKKVYCIPANSPISLMGRVVDSAHMIYALRQ